LGALLNYIWRLRAVGGVYFTLYFPGLNIFNNQHSKSGKSNITHTSKPRWDQALRLFGQGNSQRKIPVTAQTAKAITTEDSDMIVGHPSVKVTTLVEIIPSNTPITPPG